MRPMFGVFVCILSLVAASAAQESPGTVVGKNLPGTFHPYNVTVSLPVSEEPEEPTDLKGPKRPPYSTKGKYRCLITEYDQDPVVMLVAKGLDDNAAFRDLLTRLDGLLDRNKSIRLRCFVVFLNDDLDNTMTNDDKRDELARKYTKLAEDAKLTRVVLTLASKKDLAKFKFDETVALNAVLYKKLRIEALHPVDKGKLDMPNTAAIKAILSEVSTKLGAR